MRDQHFFQDCVSQNCETIYQTNLTFKLLESKCGFLVTWDHRSNKDILPKTCFWRPHPPTLTTARPLTSHYTNSTITQACVYVVFNLFTSCWPRWGPSTTTRTNTISQITGLSKKMLPLLVSFIELRFCAPIVTGQQAADPGPPTLPCTTKNKTSTKNNETFKKRAALSIQNLAFIYFVLTYSIIFDLLKVQIVRLFPFIRTRNIPVLLKH